MLAATEVEMGLERRAYARVGLLGNPSDVYNGKALSFTIADFSATVRLRPSPELLIQPHPHHDLIAFPSLTHLVSPLLSSLFFLSIFLYVYSPIPSVEIYIQREYYHCCLKIGVPKHVEVWHSQFIQLIDITYNLKNKRKAAGLFNLIIRSCSSAYLTSSVDPDRVTIFFN
jgi:glucuronokinase